MAYEFKKLSDVEVVAEPTESANVLIEENGVIKKAPKTAVGGAGGSVGWDAVFEISSDITNMNNLAPEYLTMVSGSYETLKEKIVAGEHPQIMLKWLWNYGDDYYETFVVSCVQYCTDSYILMSSWYNNGGICGTFSIKLDTANTIAEASYNRW